MSSKKAAAGSFGAPKPLPGQAGYKVSESEILEKETQNMETRLRNLQERISQQKTEDENTPKYGGARWKSARADKGSVLSYNKDVQEKHKKRIEATGGEDPVVRALLSKSSKAPKSVSGDFRTKEVALWSVEDVANWLIYLNIPQHAQSFKANEISGNILLDISLEDLDYMGITVLGHRKLIIRGIEDLRKHKKLTLTSELRTNSEPCIPDETIQRLSQSFSAKDSKEDLDSMKLVSSSVDASVKPREEKKKIHWSHLEPIANNEVIPTALPVNSTDEPDILDEAAEHEAFRKAVMEWRKAGSTTSDSGSSDTHSKVSSASNDDGMWKNPFQDLPSESSSKSRSVLIAKDMNDEEDFNDVSSESPATQSPPSSHNGGSLADGIYDEEAERKAFQEAVRMWRQCGSSASSSSAAASDLAVSSSSSATVSMVSIDARVTGKSLADKLAQELEKEKDERMKILELKKIEAQNQLRQMTSRNNSGISAKFHDLTISDVEDDGNKDDSSRKSLNPGVEVDDGYDDGNEDDDLSEFGEMDDEIDDDPQCCSHSVEVSLIESRIGNVGDRSVEDQYFVDEVDSD